MSFSSTSLPTVSASVPTDAHFEFDELGYFGAEYDRTMPWGDATAQNQHLVSQTHTEALPIIAPPIASANLATHHTLSRNHSSAFITQVSPATVSLLPQNATSAEITAGMLDYVMSKVAKRSSQSPSSLAALRTIVAHGIGQMSFGLLMSTIDELDSNHSGGDHYGSIDVGHHDAAQSIINDLVIAGHPPSENGRRKAANRNAAAAAAASTASSFVVVDRPQQQTHVQAHAYSPTSTPTPPTKTTFIDAKSAIALCVKLSNANGIPFDLRNMMHWCFLHSEMLTRLRDTIVVKSGRSSFDRHFATAIRGCGLMLSLGRLFSINGEHISFAQNAPGPFTIPGIVGELVEKTSKVFSTSEPAPVTHESSDPLSIKLCVVITKAYLKAVVQFIAKKISTTIGERPLDIHSTFASVVSCGMVHEAHAMQCALLLEQSRHIAFNTRLSKDGRANVSRVDIHPLAPYMIALNICGGSSVVPFGEISVDSTAQLPPELDGALVIDQGRFELVPASEDYAEVVDSTGYHLVDSTNTTIFSVTLDKKPFTANTTSAVRSSLGLAPIVQKSGGSGRRHVAGGGGDIHDEPIAEETLMNVDDGEDTSFDRHQLVEGEVFDDNEVVQDGAVEGEQVQDEQSNIEAGEEIVDDRVRDVIPSPETLKLLDDIGTIFSNPLAEPEKEDSAVPLQNETSPPDTAAAVIATVSPPPPRAKPVEKRGKKVLEKGGKARAKGDSAKSKKSPFRAPRPATVPAASTNTSQPAPAPDPVSLTDNYDTTPAADEIPTIAEPTPEPPSVPMAPIELVEPTPDIDDLPPVAPRIAHLFSFSKPVSNAPAKSTSKLQAQLSSPKATTTTTATAITKPTKPLKPRPARPA